MPAILQRHLGYVAIVLLNLTALGVAVWVLRDRRADAVAVLPPPTAVPAPSATPARLFVHVSGAVAAPDVVVLAEGARARDAVLAAGGFGDGADPSALNLAAPLFDGQQLHVPAVGEVGVPASARPVAGGAVAAGGDGTGGGSIVGLGIGGPGGAGSPLGGTAGAGSAVAPGAAGAAGGAAVDINRASAAEIEALPGIGPALAARIVDYRTTNGPFRAPEDLLNVSGIGEKTLARFAGQIAVR